MYKLLKVEGIGCQERSCVVQTTGGGYDAEIGQWILVALHVWCFGVCGSSVALGGEVKRRMVNAEARACVGGAGGFGYHFDERSVHCFSVSVCLVFEINLSGPPTTVSNSARLKLVVLFVVLRQLCGWSGSGSLLMWSYHGLTRA